VSEKLSEIEIEDSLKGLPKWEMQGGELVRIATFGDFKQAMTFVNAVAELAEAAGHHPDIDIRYNKVRLALVTHDAGGITENDMSLARAIDKKS
jgi:4a-hydroxytetrahydrobiopterin dehydratase